MLFQDEHAFCFWPKLAFMTAISCASLLAGYLMFTDEGNLVPFLEPYAINGNFARQVILMVFCWFYVFRLLVTNFVFLKRKMAWSEMLLVSGLMSLVLFALARAGGSSYQPIGTLDYLSILLYLSGSWLNTRSEFTRHIWKKQERNKGKLYTEGLFKHSMHINYFGDVVLFTGFALMTWRFSLLVIPLIMTLNFVFVVIPRLDKHLAAKYDDEFREYAAKTRKLIPGVY